MQEADDALCSLLHDEVRCYSGIYDQIAHDSENPKVETIEEQVEMIVTDKPTIEEVKEGDVKAEEVKVAVETQQERKFKVDYKLFNLTSTSELRLSDPSSIEKQPMVQVAKTIKSM